MTTPDAPPTRRAARERAIADAEPGGLLVAERDDAPALPGPAPAPGARVALGWVDAASLGGADAVALDTAPHPFVPVSADLLADAPRRSPWRPGVVVPALVIVALVAVYCGTTLLWPLHAVPPTVTALTVTPVAAPASTPAWPAQGSAAVGVGGIAGTVASTADPHPMASITKVVTALMVLDQQPLAIGEAGPSYAFTAADHAVYLKYLRSNESALDVPVGGTLSEQQLLEGMLMGSAGNYADRLATSIWPNDRVFASAARTYLDAHGLSGITVVEPTGIEYGNTATPAALIALGQKAMANPVIAAIVGLRSIDLPGAGRVVNTNPLLGDTQVVGIKTGSLDTYNLLAAKDVTVGGATVRLYAVVLGQKDDAERANATAALFAELEQELQPRPAVTAATVAGMVETRWGEQVRIVTADDAHVVLWNGGSAGVSASFALGDARRAGDTVGALAVTGPLDSATVDLRLADDIAGPSPWWRLTHPLELLGLDG